MRRSWTTSARSAEPAPRHPLSWRVPQTWADLPLKVSARAGFSNPPGPNSCAIRAVGPVRAVGAVRASGAGPRRSVEPDWVRASDRTGPRRRAGLDRVVGPDRVGALVRNVGRSVGPERRAGASGRSVGLVHGASSTNRAFEDREMISVPEAA